MIPLSSRRREAPEASERTRSSNRVLSIDGILSGLRAPAGLGASRRDTRRLTMNVLVYDSGEKEARRKSGGNSQAVSCVDAFGSDSGVFALIRQQRHGSDITPAIRI
jgi:hypothetical protein